MTRLMRMKTLKRQFEHWIAEVTATAQTFKAGEGYDVELLLMDNAMKNMKDSVVILKAGIEKQREAEKRKE